MPDRLMHEEQMLGNYRLVRLLGKGGFAEVYLARHAHLNRLAAIKLLYAQVDGPDVQRFKREAQIVADLRHPHIVNILDFGVQDQRTPYLIMEYAPHGTLRNLYPRGTVLPPATILSYITQVAAALDFAHSRHIIHRDVKPENMLLNERDELLLSDFGIATLISESGIQVTPHVAGTTAYMAPEQLRGKPHPASDQYALAIVVYEWLCGERPFRGSFPELVTQHLNAPPPSLRERNPRLPSTLEEVVSIALAKNPTQRYPTVSDFVADFKSALHPTTRSQPAPIPTRSTPHNPQHQPTRARIAQLPTHSEAKHRISRRAILLSLGTVATLSGIGGTLAWLSHTGGASISTTSSAPGRATATKPVSGAASPTSAPSATSTSIAMGTLIYTYSRHTSIVYAVAWSPNGKRIASGSADHTVQVWDTLTGNNLVSYALHTDAVDSVAWSPDGKYIVSGSWDRSVQVWEAFTGNLTHAHRDHTGSVFAVDWSPNGTYIASGSADSTVHVWEDFTGNVLKIFQKHAGPVYAVSWSHDGLQIASGSSDKNVLIWKVSTGEVLITYPEHTDVVYAVQWSPDGQYIASGSNDNTVQVWNTTSGKKVYVYNKHQGAIFSIVWSPDGKRIASASLDGSVHVWNASDGSNVYVYPHHKGFVHTVGWKDTYIASGGADKTVQIWQTT